MSQPHRLALVIGSGGVRSVAALGVADALERQRLQPDLIVGCSGGAMFGAALAAGRGVAHAVQLAMRLWTDELTRQRRWRAPLQLLMPRRFGFDADFALRDDRAIVGRLRAAFGDTRIEQLPVPLRITATCPASGERVVIERGPVVDALRASIALPFVFAPGRVDGRRLVDGFVSDPLPVSVAADARAVLALGFRTPLPGRVDGPRRLMAQLLAAMTNNLMDAQLAAARAAGQRLLVLEPGLERRVGLFETRAIPALVQAGRCLADERLGCIRALVDEARAPLALAA
ncbi:MAG: patatin-like phospholipase family protein [Rubrivivax sp.]